MATIYIDRQGGRFVAWCTSEEGRHQLASGEELRDVQARAQRAYGGPHYRAHFVLTAEAQAAR